MSFDEIAFLRREGGPALAYRASPAPAGGLTRVWLCGFGSDMDGTKAAHLHAAAARAGRGFLRFDYSGCGRSEGRFAEGTIGRWRDDALAMIDQVGGPVLLVGSSMGGWIALLCALARPERVKGLVLIAPAPDFTERLMKPSLPPGALAALARDGVWSRPSAYGDGPYPITQALLDDGARHLLLEAPIAYAGPVRILHGQADPDVPWRLSLEIAERLTSQDVAITFVKAGDHRLSTPADLARLEATVEALATEIGG